MALSSTDFAYVRELVHRDSAIVVEASKAYLVESRLTPVARRHGFTSLAELVACLRQGGANGVRSEVVEAMTTNETSFFRDAAPFKALEHKIIPELLQRRAAERTLTLWSAACSSGQEPYSIALLLRERFPQLATWNVRIIASDLSAEMLGRAAAGRYSQLEVNRGLPASMLVRHFRRDGAEWQLADEVRQMVEFRALNLVTPWPFVPPVDVLFLRNVLIYFDLETKRAVLQRVRRILRPGGSLFLGGTETTMNIDPAFERVDLGHSTCYRVRDDRSAA